MFCKVKIFVLGIMPPSVQIRMNLLSSSAYSYQSFQTPTQSSPSLRGNVNANGSGSGYKSISTMSIGVGMIDRLSRNVASCSACGH
jgi:ABC-type phosphate transport system substrate-binding protein